MKNLLTIILLFVSSFLTAQNSSYNKNGIPINGGTFNAAFGFETLLGNTTGDQNVAIGYKTLVANTTGNGNSAIGYRALFSNKDGNANTAIGGSSMLLNKDGTENVAIGVLALGSNTSGSENTTIGTSVMYSNLIGNFNVVAGYQAMYSNISGYNNSVLGKHALFNNLGNNNTAIGEAAGLKSTGSGNVFLGRKAGYFEAGSNKLYIANDSTRTALYADFNTGQILLGNKNPSNYLFKGTRTLNVIGGIITDSMRVALSGNWADYVFDNDYKLPSLQELANYIKVNKHLPNIPSAQEIKENGINSAEMDAKLLEKIEELHLYILQQEKRIKQLENEKR